LDGRLFVVGDKSGAVKILDVHSKSIMRKLSGHTAAVRSCCWARDSVHVISGSDDKAVKLWDLGTGDTIWESTFHSDYVRSVDSSPVDSNLFLSGGYDHSTYLWDKRRKATSRHNLDSTPLYVQEFRGTDPITQSLFSPSGTMIISASGNTIKVYDIVSGGKLLHSFENHQKNISNLCFDGTNTRLLSSGLDGHIKVYDFVNLNYVHGIKANSPILSLGVSNDNNKLIVGYLNGTLEIRNKKMSTSYNPIGIPEFSIKKETSSVLSVSNSLYVNPLDVIKTQNEKEHEQLQSRFFKNVGLSADVVSDQFIETERSAKLRAYEKYLKKFHYRKALDAALLTKNPLIVMTVLDELCRRSGLMTAISKRNDGSLEPLLTFLARYIIHPRYSKLLINVTQAVLDVYGSLLGYSEAVDELFIKLKTQVSTELKFQKQLFSCLGMLNGLINVSLIR
jgi:U3 small nucleolar RNA-associated protein 15